MTDIIQEPIEYSTFVKAPIEKVYDGIATAEGLDGWFTQGAEVVAESGGYIHFNWVNFGGDHVTAESKCPVIEVDHPNRFVFQWSSDLSSYKTTIEIDFEESDGGTYIRLKESGYHNTKSGRKAMLNCAAGWGEALTLWKFYTEHGISY